MTETLKIAIAGLGAVGASVARNIIDKKADHFQKTGKNIEIIAVSARSKKDRGFNMTGMDIKENAVDLAHGNADIIVEAIGGDGGVALDLVTAALKAKKHVVTANKALLAKHGEALAELAENNNVRLRYEAAIAGAIPIVKVLREGLAANRVSRIYGILNGTCNYIMTEMEETGADFDKTLIEAQRLGYAEADPALDIGGFDAAHKLTLLSAIAFGCAVNHDATYIEGVEKITAFDIMATKEAGYRIKLLGIATLENGNILQRVHPCLIPDKSSIAKVDGVLNAIVTDCDYAGQSLCIGRGAGGDPTASAVVADILDIARGAAPSAVFGAGRSGRAEYNFLSVQERIGKYFLRLTLSDKPGSVAGVTEILAALGISLETVRQYGRNPTGNVPVILTTHETKEKTMNEALVKISKLAACEAEPLMIRVFRP